MKLLNSTTYEGNTFEIGDVRGFIEPLNFGLPVGFYGGRVDKVSKTDYPGVYLLIEKHKVIDILIKEEEFVVEEEEVVQEEVSDNQVPFEEDIDHHKYTNDELRDMLLEIGIEAPKRATKDDLVALFNKKEEE